MTTGRQDKAAPNQTSMFGAGGSLQAERERYALYGGTPPHERSSQTSREAAQSMAHAVTPLQQQVLDVIAASGDGMTCEAIEDAIGGRHQTVSARVRELVLLERIVKRGTRKNRSGRRAAVYVLAKVSR